MLFFFGLFVNIDSDQRLRSLRSNSKDRKPGDYKIPTGGMFEYVSAANYFGEICEWWGFSLATKLNSGSLFFATSYIPNLVVELVNCHSMEAESPLNIARPPWVLIICAVLRNRPDPFFESVWMFSSVLLVCRWTLSKSMGWVKHMAPDAAKPPKNHRFFLFLFRSHISTFHFYLCLCST